MCGRGEGQTLQGWRSRVEEAESKFTELITSQKWERSLFEGGDAGKGQPVACHEYGLLLCDPVEY